MSPSHVNVYMDDAVLPYEPVNGWTIEDKTVTLVGAACARVKNGDVIDVAVDTSAIHVFDLLTALEERRGRRVKPGRGAISGV